MKLPFYRYLNCQIRCMDNRIMTILVQSVKKSKFAVLSPFSFCAWNCEDKYIDIWKMSCPQIRFTRCKEVFLFSLPSFQMLYGQGCKMIYPSLLADPNWLEHGPVVGSMWIPDKVILLQIELQETCISISKIKFATSKHLSREVSAELFSWGAFAHEGGPEKNSVTEINFLWRIYCLF